MIFYFCYFLSELTTLINTRVKKIGELCKLKVGAAAHVTIEASQQLAVYYVLCIKKNNTVLTPQNS